MDVEKLEQKYRDKIRDMIAWRRAKISHEREKKLHYEREEVAALEWLLDAAEKE
jgi:hypothetical protein